MCAASRGSLSLRSRSEEDELQVQRRSDRRLVGRRLGLRAVVVGLGCVVLLAGVGPAAARTGVARSSAAGRALTLYAVPSAFQYDNFADDRTRGEGHNPFGNYRTSYLPPPTNELSYGPFVGDEAFIDFNLYTDTSLKSAAGSAIDVCEYGFGRIAYCSATYQLTGGTIVGFASYGFNASTYTLAVTGGSGAYRGTKGLVTLTASAAARHNSTPMFADPPGVSVEAQKLTFALQPPASSASQTVSSYAYPLKQQFLDHNDDEARGDTNNPFGPRVYKQCLALPHAQEVTCAAALTNKASITIDEHNNGPFPGDQTVFSLGLYGTAKRTPTTGAAVLTCQYSYNHDGLCDETFQFKNGTLTAVGIVNFDAKSFTLALTGGNGAYSADTGDVLEQTAGNLLQHLAFTLLT